MAHDGSQSKHRNPENILYEIAWKPLWVCGGYLIDVPAFLFLGGPCTDTAHVSLITPTKRSCGTDSQSENEASPVKRPRLLERTERPEEASRSKQKSRRRCFQCQTKLELVQQELGSCRCGYVFCMLHRLPEQHDCTFDHMGRGREEAIMKMVKLDRKVGRSCQRIGEGCS
uniref:AN1-type zinc finger protein 3 n=2 Tax=Castor canadensis TaxID=51338 RepID=A0A8B7TWY3_CASCN|nr:AN1-type zinc finger protein 3 [Castor canadensis]